MVELKVFVAPTLDAFSFISLPYEDLDFIRDRLPLAIRLFVSFPLLGFHALHCRIYSTDVSIANEFPNLYDERGKYR